MPTNETYIPARGDFVRHRLLGGPVMLVRAVKVAPGFLPQATCQWFTGDGHFHQHEFEFEHIVKTDSPPTEPPKS